MARYLDKDSPTREATGVMPAKAGIQQSPALAIEPNPREYWIVRLRGR
jgi:hypothetical protein